MLSTVAERLYWAARYLERVENTARLIKSYNSLMLDIQDGVDVSWYNLVKLNSCTDTFSTRYKVQNERNVIKFLLADDSNSNSVVSALTGVRENIRTARDEVPVEAWEQINEFYLYVRENVQTGINRRHRHEFLDEVVQSSQQFNGLLSGTMSQAAGWQFLRLGRNLERADMTTRILDAGIAAILTTREVAPATNFEQIVWGNVLASLSAYVPYRKSMRTAIQGEDVVRFLTEDEYFPRSIYFCLEHMQDACTRLPRHDEVAEVVASVRKKALKNVNYEKLDQSFRDFINDIQIAIADLHWRYSENWFPK